MRARAYGPPRKNPLGKFLRLRGQKSRRVYLFIDPAVPYWTKARLKKMARAIARKHKEPIEASVVWMPAAA